MRNAWQNGSNHWVGNVWSEETPDNRYPTLTMQTSINDYNYQCSSRRVYVTGTDLWEWKGNTDDWDPEANRRITDSRRYPFLRTWTFGANLTF